jgi:hypothetical protein
MFSLASLVKNVALRRFSFRPKLKSEVPEKSGTFAFRGIARFDPHALITSHEFCSSLEVCADRSLALEKLPGEKLRWTSDQNASENLLAKGLREVPKVLFLLGNQFLERTGNDTLQTNFAPRHSRERNP